MRTISGYEWEKINKALEQGRQSAEMLRVVGEILGTLDPDALKAMREDAEAMRQIRALGVKT